MREVAEWQGKTDNAMPPPRVRLRIFNAHNGTCYLSGRKIHAGEAWDLDHIVAICNGGSNVESNLAPALKAPHKEKTKLDLKMKSKNERIRKREAGIKPPRKITQWRRMNGEIRTAGRER